MTLPTSAASRPRPLTRTTRERVSRTLRVADPGSHSACATGFVSGTALLIIALYVVPTMAEPPDAPTSVKPKATASKTPEAPAASVNSKGKRNEEGWISLFDGKSLAGWKKSEFGGEGDVSVKDGAIVMEFGADLTGVHTERELPKTNYEVQLEARRVEGSDFFCGLTFPVKDSPCSLILGGWGGGVCGLSSIDGMDASENATTSYRDFTNGKWYRIRLKVTNELIEAWIDDDQIVDQELEGHRVSIRFEVEPSEPFGISCFQTRAALRNIRIRPLPRAKPATRTGAEAKPAASTE